MASVVISAREFGKFGSAGSGEHPTDDNPDHDGLTNLLEFALKRTSRVPPTLLGIERILL